MEPKLLHTSPDLLIHPGNTIAEILEERGISQKELAIRTGFTEKHISTVINGKKSISAKMAIHLERALDVPSSFWKNLQANYDLELELFEESINIDQSEINIAKEIGRSVAKLTNEKINTSSANFLVTWLRKKLGVSNLLSIEKLNTAFYRGQFSVDSNKYVMYAWQYLSEKECESQTMNPLNIDLLRSKLIDIKSIMLLDSQKHIDNIRKILNDCGILFTIKPHVEKAPINGLTVKTKNNQVMIAMTIRKKYVDTFWFSLFHEIAHVLHQDFLVDQSNEEIARDIETKADEFARNFLIDSTKYAEFVKNKGFEDENAIVDFAKQNNILPTILIGRLLNDKYLPWSSNNLRSKYQWID